MTGKVFTTKSLTVEMETVVIGKHEIENQDMSKWMALFRFAGLSEIWCEEQNRFLPNRSFCLQKTFEKNLDGRNEARICGEKRVWKSSFIEF